LNQRLCHTTFQQDHETIPLCRGGRIPTKFALTQIKRLW
jgi:hypothetical protein